MIDLIRYAIGTIERFFVYRVLHVDDTPHRIALGVAIGVFVVWTPTLGFQMLLVIALATAVGANKVVGVPFVWISNPLTAGAIYGSTFLLGRAMLAGGYRAPNFRAALAAEGTWWGARMANGILLWWQATMKALLPLWLGGIVVGLVTGAATYLVVKYAVAAYRAHRRIRRSRRS